MDRVIMVVVITSATALIACGSAQTPNSAGSPTHGAGIAFIEASTKSRNVGTLSWVSLSDKRRQANLAENVSARRLAILPGGKLIVEGYGPPSALIVIDPATGMALDIGQGHGGIGSSTGAIAYCDNDGRLMVRLPNDSVSVVASLNTFTSCVPIAWSTADELAFVARSPLGARPPVTAFSLFLRTRAGDMREIALPVDGSPYLELKWSQDGKSVFVYSDKSGTIAVNTVTQDIQIQDRAVADASIVAFGPVDGTIATITRGSSRMAAEVFERGELSHTLSLADDPNVAIAWSPTGDQIAVSSGRDVEVWDWRHDSTQSLPGAVESSGLVVTALAWFSW